MTFSTNFRRFAWGILIYTLAVIAWGAFVRASVSGDGCGVHWPHCNGELIPLGSGTKTLVEFGHRVSSGLILPLVLVLAGMVYRKTPKAHPARWSVFGVVFFTLTEAAVGALLVLRKLVATDASVARAIWMSLHLTNTFFLLGCMALTAWYISGGKAPRWRGQGGVGIAVLVAFIGCLFLGISGAVTALGDTVFKAGSVLEGFQQDLSPTAHFLIRLRVFHPLIATSIGVYLAVAMAFLAKRRPSTQTTLYTGWVIKIFLFEFALGLVNLILNAPIELQLVHLVVADLLWVAILLSTLAAFSPDVPIVDAVPDRASLSEPMATRATLKDYVALTKPRIISLLLFTTITAMFIAKGGWPGGWLLLAVAIGGYCAAGAANAINMVIDRDIDLKMERTAKRPTVTNSIPPAHALLFAFSLAAFSFGLLTWSANLLSALMAMAGLAFYVVIYTLMLKRRTWHNIVIGGAAGSFPPLVGYAAVTNELTPMAWVLFWIIFMWTPVHFWALSLMIKEEYRDAGIPMLPVVHGDRVTIIQIGFYTVLTTIISMVPLFQRQASVTYLIASLALNAILVLRFVQLYRTPERPQAVSLFKYSMLYLALLFLLLAVDRGVSS